MRNAPLFVLGLAAGFALKSLAEAVAREAAMARPTPQPDIRPAGPEQMKAPPEKWDIVDEQGDESFPASDPPGNY